MRRERLILGILTVLVVVLLLGDFLFTERARRFLSGGAQSPDSDTPENLAALNLSLRSELARLELIKEQIGEFPDNALTAEVYSRYPFNLKSELLINRGLRDGVEPGDAVLFRGMLIGRVEKIFSRTALIYTIFDGRWRSAVRISARGFDGLLVGGPVPQVTLVVKDAPIGRGDVVLSASADLPYALPVGEIGEIVLSLDQLFQESPLLLSYDVSLIHAVSLLKANHSDD